MNIVRQAQKAGVKKIVATSSFGALISRTYRTFFIDYCPCDEIFSLFIANFDKVFGGYVLSESGPYPPNIPISSLANADAL